MSGLMNCGICCMLLSWWGIIQLALMGVLFHFEAPTLFEQCEPEEYADYDDFISKTKTNYSKVALNCWMAAGGYIITLVLSYGCIKKASWEAERLAKLEEDDEYICNLAAANGGQKK